MCCPAWDVACGIYAALSVVTALRHRDATGQGQRISIPLENVALATAGNLSFLTEVMVNGTSRERIGNSIYGQYGQEFTSSDGVSFMIVALTKPPLPRPRPSSRERRTPLPHLPRRSTPTSPTRASATGTATR